MSEKYLPHDDRYDGLDEDQADIMKMIDDYEEEDDNKPCQVESANAEKVDLPY